MGDMVNNLASSAKGMFMDGAGEKAILCILRPQANYEDMTKQGDAMNQLEEKLLKSAKNRIGLDGIKNAFTPGNKSSDGPIGETMSEDGNFVRVKVQYNPATIRLSTVNGKVQNRREGTDPLQIFRYTGKSKLSFDLVFDDCDNMNAFMLENLTPNVGNIASKATDMFSHGGLTHSVRKRMDAMMSLLVDKSAQQVIFYWSKMSFRGALTNVQNRFTMFNPAGNPIRGTMHLEITQDKSNTSVSYQEKYWTNSFEKMFKKGNEAGMASVASQVLSNNILNISL